MRLFVGQHEMENQKKIFTVLQSSNPPLKGAFWFTGCFADHITKLQKMDD